MTTVSPLLPHIDIDLKTPLAKKRLPYICTNFFGQKVIGEPGGGEGYVLCYGSIFIIGIIITIIRVFNKNNCTHIIPLFFLFVFIVGIWCWIKGTLRDFAGENDDPANGTALIMAINKLVSETEVAKALNIRLVDKIIEPQKG